MNVAPVSRGVHVMTVTLTTDTHASVAADFAVWRCTSAFAFPWAHVALEFTFVSMPTSITVAVSTVTLAMASTHLSAVLIPTFIVIALTELSCYQAPVVLVVTQTAATVTSASVRADDSLRVFAELFAFLA